MNHETSILLRLESKLIVLENRVSFLEKENKELKIQNKALKAENKELRGRLKIYENSNTPSSKKRNKKQTIGPHSSPGRCEGHKGSGRPYPKPTHEQVFSNSCCPNCTSSDINLLDKQIIIQEEISKPIPVKVIKNTIFNYKCKTCNQQFEAKNDILKNSRIGINVVTEILISKYEERLPLSKIKNKLLRQYNLKISKSGILGIINRVCDNLKCLYFKLLNLVKFMKFIYADETSWRVKGQNNWLWSFSNKLISIFMLRKSRGKGPVDEILSNYNGVIISDGWKVYEKFCRIQQRCWAHLLREARDDHSHFFEGRCMIKNLENLYYAAKQASKLKSLEEREKNYNFLICEMKTLIGYCKVDKRLRKIAKTIENGLNAWFTAILEQDIEFTNNRAEREIRESVVIRKILGGFQAKSGGECFEIMMTLLTTFKKQGKNLNESLREILIKEQFRIGV